MGVKVLTIAASILNYNIRNYDHDSNISNEKYETGLISAVATN